MKKYLFMPMLFIAAVLFSCNHKEDGNKKLDGKWYYTEAPQSYIEFNGNACTEYMGEMNATVKYDVSWTDSLHYELTVTEATGVAANVYNTGDKLQVEVKQLTDNYYRYYVESKLLPPQCIVLVRKPDYKGELGTPC